MVRKQLRISGGLVVLTIFALPLTPVCLAQGLLASNNTWLDLDGAPVINPGDTSNTPVTPFMRYNATTGWLSIDTRGVNCSVDSVPNSDGNYPIVGGDDVGFASILVEGPAPIPGSEAPWIGSYGYGMSWSPLEYVFGKAQTHGLPVDLGSEGPAVGALLSPGLHDLWQYETGLTLNDFDVRDSDGIVTLEIGLNETPRRGMPPIFSQFEIVSGIWGDLDNDNDVDAEDIDALAAAARMGSTDPKYDLNFDCNVDFGVSPGGELNTDSDELVRVILGTEYADANLDKKVDILDLSLLSSGYRTATQWMRGNFNGDAVADILDLSILSTYYRTDNTVVMAVPEPSTFVAALGALIALLAARWPANSFRR